MRVRSNENETDRNRKLTKPVRSLRSCPRKPVYETATEWFQGISLLCLYIPNLKLFTQFIAWAILQAIQFTAKKASVTVYTLLLRDGHVLKFRRKRQNYMLYPILLFLSPGFVFFPPFFNVHQEPMMGSWRALYSTDYWRKSKLNARGLENVCDHHKVNRRTYEILVNMIHT